ncbi:MAG: 50S ribosomal protein L11 [Candidatus Nanohaloarchaea archaeon]
MTETISTLVEAGNASAGPPLGPALGPLPVDIGAVVSEINERTEGFSGMEVPVDVVVDEETGSFEIEVGTPPAAALLKDRAGLDRGSGEPDSVKVANVALKTVVDIAELKMPDLVALDTRGATKEILGSAQSLGILVDGKEPVDVIAEIDDGVYDAVFAGGEELPDEPKGGEIDTAAARQELEERRAEREAEAEEEDETVEAETAADEEAEEDEEPADEEADAA